MYTYITTIMTIKTIYLNVLKQLITDKFSKKLLF